MRLPFRRPAAPAVPVVCYTKPDCCLCDRARHVLDRLARRGLVTVEYVSIAGDPALEAAYGTRIPVVTAGDGHILAEGKVAELWLTRALEAWRAARMGAADNG